MRRRPYRAGRDPVTVRLPGPEKLDLSPRIGASPRRKETVVSEYQAPEETQAMDDELEPAGEQPAPVAADAEDDWNDD
jgi:hypothetical protein